MWAAVGLALLGLAIWIAVEARRATLVCRRSNTVDRLPDGQFSSASKGLLLRLANPVRRLGVRIETDADVADLFVRMGGELAGASTNAKLSESYRGTLDAYAKAAEESTRE